MLLDLSFWCTEQYLHYILWTQISSSLDLLSILMQLFCCDSTPGFWKVSSKSTLWFLLQLLFYSHCLNILLFAIRGNALFLQQNTLKLRDFGPCRSIYSQQAHSTSPRWYWAPECLLTNGLYSYKIGMWSPGCVFYEITRYCVQWRVLLIINQDNQR